MKATPLLSLLLLVTLIQRTQPADSVTTFEPSSHTLSSEKIGSISIVRISNLIAWEEIYKDGTHGIGDGTEESRDFIPYMNQSFVTWSNGSKTVFPGTVQEARDYYQFP